MMSLFCKGSRGCRRAKLRLSHIKKKLCNKWRRPYSFNRTREYSVYRDSLDGTREEVSVVRPIRLEEKEEPFSG